MYPVIYAQWVKDKRKPFLILLFIGLSILATLLFGNIGENTESKVDIFASGPEREEIEEKWVTILNENSDIEFTVTSEEDAREQVAEGKRDVAVHVMEHDYRLITSSDMPNVQLVEQEVHKIFTEEAELQALTGTENTADIRKEVKSYLENAPLLVETEAIQGGELTKHDMGKQLLFVFTLFIAMFTIGFKVNGINADKVSGVWNRLILSPVSKVGMYSGHLVYSFIIGFFQMVVVLVLFKYVFDFEIGNFAMILTIAAVFTLSAVSLAMLITGIAQTPEKFYMIYPSLLPIIPGISGLYMAPGVMDNPVFTVLADIFPLGYAVEAMLDVALYNAGWGDILLPIAFMLLLAVMYMGIGINLGERRK
ncbi:ABC transporter permease [Salirhabdus sp. Marseille-P4669]|uniref:ABC transporter permease n=1 Tax=Salirhabdus sp. Marseille-P4669 TaxID=2042310 RepID=UPI000C7E3F11|nr:ABC transporter permease [Salirhabdus sp. Marseille-P4669]